MPRVGNGGHATAVVKSHYPKNLIFISRQDSVAGVHTCLPRMTIEPRARASRVGPLTAFARVWARGGSRRTSPRCRGCYSGDRKSAFRALRVVSKRLGSPYRSGRSAHWVKVKNPKAPAVGREAEENWGR